MPPQGAVPRVASLLDAVVDGREYESIVGLMPPDNLDLVVEMQRALGEIERIRSRPCLAYAGNIIKSGDTSIDSSDDLPFAEMIAAVPAGQRNVDVFLATPGGSGQQVARFVNCLRSRFDEVDFIIPSLCMSAGTLFALSGNRIWMTSRAYLGPIDPQVPTATGRYVPAQALLLLVDELQRQGEQALQKGQNVPWAAVRIIDTIDKKELGEAITASAYSKTMAADFINNYKFRDWAIRETSRVAVTPEYRRQRAEEIASALVQHERWKDHGHSISRDVLWNEIKLHIDTPTDDFERAILRAWAVFHWIFDKTFVFKTIVSANYRFLKLLQQPEKPK
jgi:hypothetical protein